MVYTNTSDGVTAPAGADAFNPPVQHKATVDSAARFHTRVIYADSTAMNAETRMVKGWRGYTADFGIEYEYSGTAWVPQTGDSGWIYPTLTNGTPSPGNVFGYRRLYTAGVKVVYLRGRVSALSSGQIMVTLPVGFRPDAGPDNVLILDSNANRVNFTDGGTIVALATISGSISFLGVNYIAA